MSAATDILVVDDNPADSDLTREALEQGQPLIRVKSVQNGLEAVAFLRRQGRYANEPRTHFVILDLNMPLRDGRAVLAEAKSDPILHNIPIVIFTTSQADSDVQRSYELGANCYVSKPGNLKDYVSTVQSIAHFWLGLSRLPHREDER